MDRPKIKKKKKQDEHDPPSSGGGVGMVIKTWLIYLLFPKLAWPIFEKVERRKDMVRMSRTT